MRRWLVFICGFVILLTGCHAPPQPPSPVTAGFACDVAIIYREMNLAGRLTRSAAGTLELTLSEPESLQGVTLTFTGDEVVTSLHGLQFFLSPDNLPAEGLGRLLVGALDAAIRTSEEGILTEAGWEWSGQIHGYAVTLLADPEDGQLLSLSAPAIPLSVTFSRFERISE